MRGYFAFGVEGISKDYNLGNLMRSAHAFNAQFFFAINPDVDLHKVQAVDTSDAWKHVPFYKWDTPEKMVLPHDCALIGVEFVDESISLPSFRHPARAAYVVGPEDGSLSPEMMARCDHVIKIPTSFCVNVGTAGAIVMYDRMISMGKHAERPVSAATHKANAIKRRQDQQPKDTAALVNNCRFN